MKIALDFGHGCNFDSGAVGIIREEKAIEMVGNPLITYLKNMGHDVLLVRPLSATSVNNSLAQRVSHAAEFKADLLVSIHANVTAGGHGTEVFTYGGKPNTKAVAVLNNICKLGFTNRGIKGSTLYLTSNTTMESMLIELCFIDSQSDVDLLNKYYDDMARAIAEGITDQVVTNSLDFNIHMTANIQDMGIVLANGVNVCKIGTEGLAKRLEMFSMTIDGVDFTYQIHEEDVGDTQVVGEGAVLGTIGVSKRIEGITINVTKIQAGYKLQYRAHIENIGTTEWFEPGQFCGTKGKSFRVEAIEVKIIKI